MYSLPLIIVLVAMVTTCWSALIGGTAVGRLEFDPGGAENLTLKDTVHIPIKYVSNDNVTLVIQPIDTQVIYPETSVYYLSSCDNATSGCTVDVVFKTNRIGRTQLKLTVYKGNSTANTSVELHYMSVSVVIKDSMLKMVMRYVTTCLLVLINLVMGCKMQWLKLKEVFYHPVALFVGLTCQILFMPLLAFALANAFFLDDGLSLGLLIVGTAPGGGISNVIALVTDGDLDFSASMTICSTLLAFGVMPLWLFTYGQFFRSSPCVPYVNILINLCLVSIPLLFGVLLQHKRPLWAEKLIRLIRPVSLVVMLVMIGLSIYANLHIFDILSWQSVISCLLLPITGLIVGSLTAVIFRQNVVRGKTIAVDVGIQNTVLSVSVVQLSWVSPERDIIFTMPASVLILTLVLMLIICTLHILLSKYSKVYREFSTLKNKLPSKHELPCNHADNTVEKMIDSGDIVLKESVLKLDDIISTKRFSRSDLDNGAEDMNLNSLDRQKLSDKVLNTDSSVCDAPVHNSPRSRHSSAGITPQEISVGIEVCYDNSEGCQETRQCCLNKDQGCLYTNQRCQETKRHYHGDSDSYETQSNTIQFDSDDDDDVLDSGVGDMSDQSLRRKCSGSGHRWHRRTQSGSSADYQTTL